MDIETAPNLVHVWGLYQQNVSIKQIINSSYVLCWAAKWYGKKKIFFDSCFQSKHKKMIKGVYDLLDEADAVVHYNGANFDIPTLNKEFLLLNMTPPAPVKQIDLLRVARKQFKFSSNKLDYVAQQLGLGKKSEHTGHQLWIDCMAKIPKAWKIMERYNKNDVVLLEKVYDKLMPWIKTHPNRGVYDGTGATGGVPVCPNCGSTNVQSRGFAYTTTRRYRRFLCTGCGDWLRNSKTVTDNRERYVNV